MKHVDILVGIPCSGKTTFRNNSYNQNDIFVISRDDIRNKLIEEYEISYQDKFKKSKEDDPIIHPVYGIKTQNGNWSNIENMNNDFKERFEYRKEQAVKEIENGKRVVFDNFVNTFENVETDEGFDHIVVIDGLKGLKKNQKIKRKIS